MSAVTLEERVTALEDEVAQIREQGQNASSSVPWWDKIAGIFENDSLYEEAMRLGQEYRRAQPTAYDLEADYDDTP